MHTRFYTCFTLLLAGLLLALGCMAQPQEPIMRVHKAVAAHIGKKPGHHSQRHLPLQGKQKQHHRSHTVKHPDLPVAAGKTSFTAVPSYLAALAHTPALPPAYRYLYFKDITPPPPKAAC